MARGGNRTGSASIQALDAAGEAVGDRKARAEEASERARGRLAEQLAATGKGDQAAFAALYREAAPKLYGIALRILKQEASAQECLQDAWVRIWEHAGDYRPERGAPMTWMGVIVRRRALDMLRRGQRERLPEDAEEVTRQLDHQAWADRDPQGELVDPHQRDALVACLARLREEQQQALRLAYFEGLSHPELAEHLAVPLGTVKTWIRRGMEKLRQCLEA